MHSHFLFDAHELCYASRRVAFFIHRDDATSTEGLFFQTHGSCYVTTRVAIFTHRDDFHRYHHGDNLHKLRYDPEKLRIIF